MATAPKTKFASSSQKPTKWAIRLGLADGTAPTAASETSLLRHPVVTLAHGSRNCHCEFTYSLELNGERVQDTYLKAKFARQVEVVQKAKKKGMPDTLLFWGEIGEQKLSVNDRGEDVKVRATIEDYHFGIVCRGPSYRDPTGLQSIFVRHDPIVFNPEINGVVEFNRSVHEQGTSDLSAYKFWVHPDSVRTAVAKLNAQDTETVGEWTLAQAVSTMVWINNISQTYIKNPSPNQIYAWLRDAPAVRNLELPSGRYLPEYLDRMLNPYGYGWAMTFRYDAAGDRVVSWRIFKLNDDQAKSLLMQRPNTTRNTTGIKSSLHNVKNFTVETSILGQANKVTVLMDNNEYEGTFELYRGWPEADDSLTAEGLTQSTGADWETHQRAWRLWVLNEAGDYCSTRTVVKPIPATPYDLENNISTDFVIPRNRKPYDCLTHWKDDSAGEKKRRRPPFIEWHNGSDWAPLPDGWGETVLDDQIGVIFAANAPPAELINMGANARIRITCTIRSEVRQTQSSGPSANSVNLRTNEMVVDQGDRFKYRVVVSSGTNTSVLGGTPSSDAVDNSAAALTLAGQLRTIEDAANTRASVIMFGLHPELSVGQTLDKIKGRNVSLNRMAGTATVKTYLQIMSLTHDQEKQETTLKVAPILGELS
jgi:hypothetical protein